MVGLNLDCIIRQYLAVARHHLLFANGALFTLTKRLMELVAGCKTTRAKADARRHHRINLFAKTNPTNENIIRVVVRHPLSLL